MVDSSQSHIHRMAATSLVLGLCGLPSFGATAVIGLISGVVALAQINAGHAISRGKTIAMWGVVTSSVSLLLAPIMLFLIFRTLSTFHPPELTVEQKEVLMQENLKDIQAAVARFYVDTGTLPADLDDLVARNGYAVSARIIPQSYHGPYLRAEDGIGNTAIPRNPFLSKQDHDITHHWRYTEGDVFSKVHRMTASRRP